MAKYQSFLSRIGSNRDRAALRGIFSQFLTDDDPPALKDLVLASIILSGSETTQITISGACTTAISISAAFTTGISISGDGTTAISVTSGFSGTNMISLAGTGSTSGILISGACGIPLNITGAFTTGITIAADGTTGISITSAFSGVNAISLSGTGSTAGINISGDHTTAITIGAQTTAGLAITGATATGISITGACATAALQIGSSGTPAGDVNIWGATAAAKMMWDSSADSLLLQGNARLQVGESTTGVVTAGGTTMIYGYAVHKTNALTGTLRGVRGNAAVLVASAAGTAIGGDFRVANGSSTTATDGVNAGTIRGMASLVAGVGQSGPATITSAQGIYTQLDLDAANLTITDARGLYVNVQSGNASANTLTACNLAYLEYESVVGTAPAINSCIKMACVGGTSGVTYLIDASTVTPVAKNANQNVLMAFKDTAGTVRYLVFDPDSSTVVAVTDTLS